MSKEIVRYGTGVLWSGKCHLCNSAIKYNESTYIWFRKFIIAKCCTDIYCRYSKIICLICKESIEIDGVAYYGILYFKHILTHYGLDVDYKISIDDYIANPRAIDTPIVYSSKRQLLFVDVELPVKYNYLELDDILCELKDFTSSCLICKQLGVDTFYESFPTLEVIVSHLMKVHVDPSAVIAGLPPLIDIVSDVDFK